MEVIDRAEGYPAESGDKYLDAKTKIERSIVVLNYALSEAGDIGLHTEVETEVVFASTMPIKGRVCNAQFKLAKIYKEF